MDAKYGIRIRFFALPELVDMPRPDFEVLLHVYWLKVYNARYFSERTFGLRSPSSSSPDFSFLGLDGAAAAALLAFSAFLASASRCFVRLLTMRGQFGHC